jgi:hypothetical protein
VRWSCSSSIGTFRPRGLVVPLRASRADAQSCVALNDPRLDWLEAGAECAPELFDGFVEGEQLAAMRDELCGGAGVVEVPASGLGTKAGAEYSRSARRCICAMEPTPSRHSV